MKFTSVYMLSVIIAFMTFAVTFAGELIFGTSLLLALGISLTISVIIYIVSYFVVSRYAISRIKPLYQMMLEKNIKSSDLLEKSHKEDIVEAVSNEISEWATKKSNEIIKLKQLETYRKEFLGNVSHELKTPLFTIQGYLLTIIDDELEDKEMSMKFLNNANNAVQRMITIVKDLEQISLLEMDILRLDKSKFDIVEITNGVLERMSMQAEKRGIKLTCKADNEILVYADQNRIEQVLINLVSNAIKYGSDNGTMTVEFLDGFNRVVIEITDDGVGIPKEDISRIFERFFRVDKSRSRETGGTGLGLAIVKHILDAHSSKINVRSKLGEYTTFSFSLNKYLS
ncbi:MAG: ATP-binding protein [Rikenellaceae bacterium]